jgi:hypothetical protein
MLKPPYRRASFPWQVYFLVWTVNTFSLTSLPWEKFCCSCARYVVNIYLMSRSPCTLVKFALVGGYIHEQIVLVQKLPWVSLEQCSCTRKNRHFRRTREQIFFYLNIFIHGNLSDILRLSVLELIGFLGPVTNVTVVQICKYNTVKNSSAQLWTEQPCTWLTRNQSSHQWLVHAH